MVKKKLIIACALLLVLSLTLLLTFEYTGWSVYIIQMNNITFALVLIQIMLILFACFMGIKIQEFQVRKERLYSTMGIILCIVILIAWLLVLFIMPPTSYMKFTSTDELHTIIVGDSKEMVWGSEITIYERTSFFTMQRLYELYSNSRKPFREGNHEFVWLKDGFILRYDDGRSVFNSEWGDYEEIWIEYFK